MAYLSIDATDVPVRRGGAVADHAEHRLDRERMFDGTVRKTAHSIKRVWTITTRLLTEDEAIAVRDAVTVRDPVLCTGDLFLDGTESTDGVSCWATLLTDSPEPTASGPRWRLHFTLHEVGFADQVPVSIVINPDAMTLTPGDFNGVFARVLNGAGEELDISVDGWETDDDEIADVAINEALREFTDPDRYAPNNVAIITATAEDMVLGDPPRITHIRAFLTDPPLESNDCEVTVQPEIAWIVHTFDNPNTPPAGFSGLYVDPYATAFVVTAIGDEEDAVVEVLLQAGGGGGASVTGSGVSGGGGGGGRAKEWRDGDAKTVTVGSYGLLIGAGGREGLGATGASTGNNGSNTTGFGETVQGGGGGGGKDLSLGVANQRDGRDGGCGGGGGCDDTRNGIGGDSDGYWTFQGVGGNGSVADNAGGGGGSDEAVGNGSQGIGGDGLYSDIDGTPKYYGSGGAGPRNVISWPGLTISGLPASGYPGPGSGGAVRSPGVDGLGGGGGGSDGNGHGGRGGNGRIIIRYRGDSGIVAAGGTITYL